MKNPRSTMFLAGTLLGIIYGLFAIFEFSTMRTRLASASFLALVPAALGFLPLAFVDDAQVVLYRKTLFTPWVSLGGLLLVTGAMGVEPLILVAIATPFILVLTLALWVILGLRLWRLSRRKRFWAAAGLMILPFTTASWEERVFAGEQTIEVRRTVVVKASTRPVWEVIVDPGHIGDREYGAGLFGTLGVPHPSFVTTDGAPAMRASQQLHFSDGDWWEGEITGYDPELLLKAAPDQYFDLRWEIIEPGSFREHLGEIGLVELRRFDYLLTPAGDGRTRLTMVAAYALTSSVNRYAHFWIRAAIDDSEEHLLAVFKRRAERRV